MKAVVAERGQVTIPKEIRTKLGIKPGTILEFNLDHGVLHVEKFAPKDPFEEVFGCLRKQIKSDEILRELRGSL